LGECIDLATPLARHFMPGRAIGQPGFRSYMLLNPSMM